MPYNGFCSGSSFIAFSRCSQQWLHMVLALKLALLTGSSLSYNNNEITLKRQTLRSHPLRPSAFAGGEWLPANLPCNQRRRRGSRIVFSSRCLNCIRLFPNTLKASKAPGDGVGRRERPSARRRGEARGTASQFSEEKQQKPRLAVHLGKQGLSQSVSPPHLPPSAKSLPLFTWK